MTGGLNLLPPSDKLAEGQSLALENWRVDQAGQLVSRRGVSQLILFNPSVGRGHTLFRTGVVRCGGMGAGFYGGNSLEFLLGGAGLGNSFDGQPLGIAAYQRWIWVMNQARQGKVRATPFTGASALGGWTLDAPTSAAAAGIGGGGPTTDWDGDFTFFVTFDTVDGQESNPSPASNTLTLNTVLALPPTLIGIPVSFDASVTMRHIYAIGGPLDVALRLDTINDNITTTWTPGDSITPENAVTLDDPMPLDHDPPPAAAGLLGPYFGKLIAWSSLAHPARYWWTPTAQPWFFPGSNDDFEGNWEDAGDDLDPLLVITNHKRLLILYKQRTIWRIAGDPDLADPEQTNAGLGAVGRQAVANAGAVDYFVGYEGIYMFDGDSERKVSQALDPIFRQQWTELADVFQAGPLAVGGLYIQPLNRDAISTCVLEYVNGRLYFSYPEGSNTSPSATLVLDTATGQWHIHRLPTSLGPQTGFSCLHYEGQGGKFAGLVTQPGGTYLVSIDDLIQTDLGYPISLVWQSRYLDQGLPDNDKVYTDLAIEYRTADGPAETPSTLTVQVLYDDGTVEAVGTLTSASWATAPFSLGSVAGEGRTARRASVRITGAASSTCRIRYVHLYYYVLARKGRSYDTGVIDLGSRQVKQVDRLEMETTATDTVTWKLYSDLPGGAVAQRRTSAYGTAAANPPRTVVPVTLADPSAVQSGTLINPGDASGPVEGRILRLALACPGDLQVHRIRMRARVLGEYFDGSRGEFFESLEIG